MIWQSILAASLFFIPTAFAGGQLPWQACVTTAASVQPIELPPHIPPNESQPVLASEYPRAGSLLTGDQRLPTLPNGRYVYVIARTPEGQLVTAYSLRVPDANASPNGQFLVTHRSLTALLPAGSTVHAAGEFMQVNGVCREFNNGAGSRRGTTAHLTFAQDWMQTRGLPLQTNTWMRDYSAPGVNSLEHAAAEVNARIQLAFGSNNARFHALRSQAELLFERAHRRFPVADNPVGPFSEWTRPRPGSVDIFQVFDAMDRVPPQSRGPRHLDDMAEMNDFFRIASVDGIEFAINVVSGRVAVEMAAANDRRTEEYLRLTRERFDRWSQILGLNPP